MSGNAAGGVIRVAESQVKLDEERAGLRVLTVQSTPATDPLRPGVKVRYKGGAYEVVRRWKPRHVTPAVVRVSLKLLPAGRRKAGRDEG